MTFLKDLVLWIYWHPFKLLAQNMPPRAVYFLARFFGISAYYCLPRRRKLLKSVVKDIFPGGDDTRVGRIVRNAFIVLIRNEMDVLLFPKLNKANIGSFVRCSGLEHLDDALSKGKGAILLFGHFGANQMIMPAIGYRGYGMCQLSAPPTVWVEKLPNRKFSDMAKRALEIRWLHEMSLPVRHINIFGSLKEAFLCLKRNDVLGVAMDGGGGKERITTPFLGRNAQFSTGAFEIVMRTGCEVLPTFIIRDEQGFHRMIIEQPLSIPKLGDRDENIRKSLGFFIARLETYVLKYPCHYINFLSLRKSMELQGDIPFFVGR